MPDLRWFTAGEPPEFRLLTSEVFIGSGEDYQFVIRRLTVFRRHLP